VSGGGEGREGKETGDARDWYSSLSRKEEEGREGGSDDHPFRAEEGGESR